PRSQLSVQRREVLPVDIVVDPSPHPVIARVSKVHSRVIGLIIVGAPVVQDGLTVAMQVDQVSDVRKAIEQPDHVPRLGLRGGAGAHVTLIVARFEGTAYGIGSKVPVETPQEGEVPIDVHTDTLPSAALGCRPPVFPPPRIPLHAEMAAVGIHLGKDY